MLDKVIGLLKDEAIEKRIAAAIVLGELKAKSPEATAGLVGALGSDIPLLQKHALDALGQARPARALDAIFPFLVSHNAELRHAAQGAIIGYGEDALTAVKARLPQASPEERRALDGILAELGGKGAFSTLLASLAVQEEEAAKRAAVAVRTQIKSADGNQRRTYLAETEKFLAKQAQAKTANVPAIASGVKILGYLEDARAVPTLLGFVTDKKAAPSVKQEAFIALRFCMSGKRADKKLVDALVVATESEDRTLAQTALFTLASLDLSDDAVARLGRLLGHKDPTRVQLVVDQLQRRGGKDAAAVLVEALVTQDRVRAEMAAKGLAGNEEAAIPLARALLETDNPDKAWVLRNALRPLAKKIPAALQKELLEVALKRLGGEGRGYEAHLDVVRDADSALAFEGLRALYTKLDRAGKDDRAIATLRLVVKSEKATDEDRYALSARQLRSKSHDTSPQARAADESLRLLGELMRKNFDVVRALKKDKKMPIEALYYVGFHFAEQRAPQGEELLEEVATQAGRAKIGKMAKNKLKLVQRAPE
jgi:hypothetical protein